MATLQYLSSNFCNVATFVLVNLNLKTKGDTPQNFKEFFDRLSIGVGIFYVKPRPNDDNLDVTELKFDDETDEDSIMSIMGKMFDVGDAYKGDSDSDY